MGIKEKLKIIINNNNEIYNIINQLKNIIIKIDNINEDIKKNNEEIQKITYILKEMNNNKKNIIEGIIDIGIEDINKDIINENKYNFKKKANII